MFDIFAQAFGIWFVVMLLYVMVAECRACESAERTVAEPARRPVSVAQFCKAIATAAMFLRF